VALVFDDSGAVVVGSPIREGAGAVVPVSRDGGGAVTRDGTLDVGHVNVDGEGDGDVDGGVELTVGVGVLMCVRAEGRLMRAGRVVGTVVSWS